MRTMVAFSQRIAMRTFEFVRRMLRFMQPPEFIRRIFQYLKLSSLRLLRGYDGITEIPTLPYIEVPPMFDYNLNAILNEEIAAPDVQLEHYIFPNIERIDIMIVAPAA